MSYMKVAGNVSGRISKNSNKFLSPFSSAQCYNSVVISLLSEIEIVLNNMNNRNTEI